MKLQINCVICNSFVVPVVSLIALEVLFYCIGNLLVYAERDKVLVIDG